MEFAGIHRKQIEGGNQTLISPLPSKKNTLLNSPGIRKPMLRSLDISILYDINKKEQNAVQTLIFSICSKSKSLDHSQMSTNSSLSDQNIKELIELRQISSNPIEKDQFFEILVNQESNEDFQFE